NIEQVQDTVHGPICQTILYRRLSCSVHQGFASLHAHLLPHARSQWQREITMHSEETGHELKRYKFKQAQRSGDQHPVDLTVHLREISGSKRHSQAKLGEMVGQTFSVQSLQRVDGIYAFRLQPPHHRMAGRKLTQRLDVASAQWLHMPQQQRRALIPHGHFNLRNAFWRTQIPDQISQGPQEIRNLSGQNKTVVHISHVTASLFPKSHKYTTLLGHQTHGQARTIPIAPGRSVHGTQDVLRTNLADMSKRIFQHPLFDCHLCLGPQVLHCTASALAKVRTRWVDTLRRRPKYLLGTCNIE